MPKIIYYTSILQAIEVRLQIPRVLFEFTYQVGDRIPTHIYFISQL